ncbi:hypothetical protein V6N13_048530 [Hibiscus sabdariffa]
MQSLEVPAHCYNLEEEVDGHPWYYNILQYIKFQSWVKGQMTMIKGPSEGWRLATYWIEKSCTKRGKTRRIMRYGYFWFTMEKDCIDYARRCHKCQIYADKMHAPPFPLHTMNSPWPFAVWGMDVIGQIHPKAFNGHRFILVVIDYFTKWVEAASYANITRETVCKFLKKEII